MNDMLKPLVTIVLIAVMGLYVYHHLTTMKCNKGDIFCEGISDQSEK